MNESNKYMNQTNNQKIYIVIPAFNEGKIIKKTITSLQKAGYHNIIIVDDGSSDNTCDEAKSTNAEVLCHIINRGQGASLLTGIQYTTKTYNPDIIVTFDSDGQHRPEDIKALIQPIINDSADIVLGSRFLNTKTKVPPVRKIILKAGIFFTNITSRVKLTDTHNGLRALGPKAMTSIKIPHRGMEHASDIIDSISKNKLRYQEVPVKILYTDYSINKGQASIGFIKMGIKIILHKILS